VIVLSLSYWLSRVSFSYRVILKNVLINDSDKECVTRFKQTKVADQCLSTPDQCTPKKDQDTQK